MSNRKPSAAWLYFEALPEQQKAKCNICGTLLAYKSSTSCLRNHLAYKHPSVNLNKLACPSSAPTPPAVKFKIKDKEPKSESTVSVSDLYVESLEWDDLTNSLVEFCAVDMLPLSIVHGPGFQTFCSKLQPEFNSPSPTTIQNQLSLFYSTAKDSLMEALSKCLNVCLSLESWTHLSCKSYTTLSVHYIDDSWQIHHRILNSYPTSKMLNKPTLVDVLNEFNISYHSVLAVTSSDGAQGGDLSFPTVLCVASAIEKSVLTGLSLPNVARIVKVCSDLPDYITGNGLVNDSFVMKQRQLHLPVAELLRNVPSRWNSSFFMLQRILEQRLAIAAILQNRDILQLEEPRLYELSEEEWTLLEDIIQVLEPLNVSASVIDENSYSSASIIYPIVTGLLNIHLKNRETDSIHIKHFKSCIADSLKHLLFSNIDLPVQPAVIASAVDPRYKQLKFLSLEQKNEVWNQITEKLVVIKRSEIRNSKLLKARCPTGNSDDEDPQSKRAKTMEYLLGDYYDLADSTDTTETKAPQENDETHELEAKYMYVTAAGIREDAVDEVVRYKAEIISVNNVSSLEWWRCNCRRFPLLASLASKYLSIPAICKPSEHFFTPAAEVFATKRSSLDTDTMNQLLFVRNVL